MSAGAAIAAAVPSAAEATLSASLGEPWMTIDAGPLAGPIRLNRNENPYGPSVKVIATMQEAARNGANRHPEADVEALRNKIADVHHVTPEQVVLGSGASEVLRMAAEAFVGSGGKPGTPGNMIVARPTFGVISAYARRAGADVVDVPLARNHSHDLDAMLARTDSATGLIYICNPNNPTGSLTRRQDLDAWLRALPATTYVLIDEAYHHYVGNSSDYASFIDRPPGGVDDSRVIVARSFSKIHGLAGIRIGYAVAAAETARRLAACALSDDVNVVAARAAVTALDDAEHVRLGKERNDDDRQEFYNQLNARMLRAIDSLTNFVMFNTERPAADVVDHFKKNNVLVSGSIPGFDKYIRVSFGTRAEMQEFWRVWDLMPHKMAM